MDAGGKAGEMPVGGRIAVLVIDQHEIAVAAEAAFLLHHAGAGRHHRRSDGHAEIDALVHAAVAEDRVEAHAEAGGDARAVHRRLHQHALGALAVRVEIVRRFAVRLVAIECDRASADM